jgi:hypothetical protein
LAAEPPPKASFKVAGPTAGFVGRPLCWPAPGAKPGAEEASAASDAPAVDGEEHRGGTRGECRGSSSRSGSVDVAAGWLWAAAELVRPRKGVALRSSAAASARAERSTSPGGGGGSAGGPKKRPPPSPGTPSRKRASSSSSSSGSPVKVTAAEREDLELALALSLSLEPDAALRHRADESSTAAERSADPCGLVAGLGECSATAEGLRTSASAGNEEAAATPNPEEGKSGARSE